MIFFVICQVLGGTLVALSWIPQILHAIKGKTAYEIDLRPLTYLFVGSLLMEIYSIELALQGEAIALFWTNTINLVVVTSLISVVFWSVPEDQPKKVKIKKEKRLNPKAS